MLERSDRKIILYTIIFDLFQFIFTRTVLILASSQTDITKNVQKFWVTHLFQKKLYFFNRDKQNIKKLIEFEHLV